MVKNRLSKFITENCWNHTLFLTCYINNGIGFIDQFVILKIKFIAL